jgi:hypothetical protein
MDLFELLAEVILALHHQAPLDGTEKPPCAKPKRRLRGTKRGGRPPSEGEPGASGLRREGDSAPAKVA